MPFMMDGEVAAALALAVQAGGQTPVPPRGDAQMLRALTNETLAATDQGEPDSPGVRTEDHSVVVDDGARILARWYTKNGSAPGSAVVYVHGGGMVCGSVELYDRIIAKYVQQTGVPFLAVDYRLAPEHPGLAPINDSYAALRWLRERAPELGVDPDRIAVMGDSAGGGIAAGVAIAARDGGVPLAKQILIYPMLDDRNTEPDPELVPFATWTYDNNYTGWTALLGDAAGGAHIPPLAAPARLDQCAELAPTFIDVGELDILRDESVRYALALTHGGVSCELHVRAGAPHGFDRIAPSARVSDASWSDRYRVIATL